MDRRNAGRDAPPFPRLLLAVSIGAVLLAVLIQTKLVQDLFRVANPGNGGLAAGFAVLSQALGPPASLIAALCLTLPLVAGLWGGLLLVCRLRRDRLTAVERAAQVEREAGAVLEMGEGAVANELAVVNSRLEAEIAVRRELEAKLDAADARLRALTESMTEALTTYEAVDQGRDFVIRECNAACERLNELDRRLVLGRRLRDLFPDAQETGLLDALTRVWRTGEPERLSLARRRDKRIESWRENVLFRLPGGETAAFCLDLAEQKRNEEALRESEERHRRLYNNTPAMLHSIDAKGRLIGVSDYWLTKMGYERGEVLGRKSTDFLTEDSRRYAQETVLPEFFRTGGCRNVPYRLVTKDGSVMDVLLSATSERDAAGNVERSLAVVLDVTERKAERDRLWESERRLRDAALTSGDWLWEVDASGRYVYASDSVERILGREPREIIGKTPFDLMPGDEAERVGREFARLAAAKVPIHDLENWNLRKDGSRVCLLTNGVPLLDRAGELTGYFGVDKDVTAGKEAEDKLRLYEKMFESALEGILVADASGTILAVNPAFQELSGYKTGEILGQPVALLRSDRLDDAFLDAARATLAAAGRWDGEIWLRRKDGQDSPQWAGVRVLGEAAGEAARHVIALRDLTDSKRQEELLRRQAYHDPLTDLPNRALFKDRLGVALAGSTRSEARVAVILMDLDNFKTINDSLGHAVGDELLMSAADRLAALTRAGDALARLGGDEFGFLLDDLEDETPAVKLAERILAAMEEPFLIRGEELFVTPSIGVALHPDDGVDAETLLKNADAALYQAKELGRNRYRLFQGEMNERVSRRLELENSLRRALGAGEFFLLYQPKVDILSGAVTGMEALARWERSGEIISPMEFIPLAEETGLIVPLGRLVLDMACEQAGAFFALGGPEMRVAVNLSPRQFQQPDLAGMVASILEKRGLPPERLDLEITETAIARDIETSIAKLGALRDMGVTISVDDFGTGYSSLAYLKHFPISTIKIDRAFVNGLGVDKGDENIVRTVIQLAKNFGLKVVAEGAETKDQVALLKYYGCDQVQGYYYSRPLSAEAMLEFLARRKAS